jgi:hypothetical protein
MSSCGGLFQICQLRAVEKVTSLEDIPNGPGAFGALESTIKRDNSGKDEPMVSRSGCVIYAGRITRDVKCGVSSPRRDRMS